jgi:hypothetical protein
MPFSGAGVCARLCESSGMKKYIRQMFDDLNKQQGGKDYIPPIPAAPTDGKVIDLDVPPEPVVPEDLENQELSSNPDERVRQLDQQAQDEEIMETLE